MRKAILLLTAVTSLTICLSSYVHARTVKHDFEDRKDKDEILASQIDKQLPWSNETDPTVAAKQDAEAFYRIIHTLKPNLEDSKIRDIEMIVCPDGRLGVFD